ncbi:putative DNA modification/repair radical SAM protein [Geobacter pelophilus]|uniref:DNA modification/repair radical SAM protein n=1 Tax=Geoanaerobacter pelophilus TaxID=60036 RepID=A0AAW4L8V9_9BACT|nr:putative DNA modification/repair radical SAM protein [Geoanaerobacter pelophilus]MBT0665005.1 putative DNA modification/repair radical SAM protein [Geoanaerobacter pelophilus]
MAVATEMMDKLKILAEGAKYDVSCSSSGSFRRNKDGIGNAASCGICHTWTSDGRCVSLLKVLMTNSCIFDCAYCVNRRSNDVQRVLLTPAEVAELTIGFYRRNYIEGLFLSTGVVRSPDYTMELLIEAVRTLREQYRFNGYIHLKLVPGADPLLVQQAGLLADRVSVNLELPTREGLALLAPDKSRDAVIGPMRQVNSLITINRAERKESRKVARFAPAGQSTQLIVGATKETDRQIVTLSEQLYQRMELKRVYYSAFIPVVADTRLPALPNSPLRREHRLYQADWLLRYYGFSAQELLDEERPNLETDLDPKTGWALRHLELFPVEINGADYEVLLRIPGIGVRSAQRIVRARRQGHLSMDDLAKLGVVLKRARYFITARGRYAGECAIDSTLLRSRLLETPAKKGAAQLELPFSRPQASDEAISLISGEL